MSRQIKLTASATLLVAIMLAFQNFAPIANITPVTDSAAGSASINYVNIEFSQDGRYAIFLEGISTSGNVQYSAWLSQVDLASGQLVPANGKGFLLGKAAMVGMPQFGHDSVGAYAIMLNESGILVAIRPNGNAQPTITAIKDTASQVQRMKRAFPYASRNPNSPLQYITYQLRDQANGVFRQYLVEITKNPTVAPVSNNMASLSLTGSSCT